MAETMYAYASRAIRKSGLGVLTEVRPAFGGMYHDPGLAFHYKLDGGKVSYFCVTGLDGGTPRWWAKIKFKRALAAERRSVRQDIRDRSRKSSFDSTWKVSR